MTFERLLGLLPARPNVADIASGFIPPPRFRGASFDNYQPQHPSQTAAVARLSTVAGAITAGSRPSTLLGRLLGRSAAPRGGGIYLDGGFGVGKTHLLAAFWHQVPEPRAYLSFDELMYFVGMAGAEGAADVLGTQRLIAIDEWELDDPGNLKMALAVVRRVLARGAFVATTSNTLPLDLGVGRFSQKDFRGEIEELVSAFEVVTIEGEDYRHRHFHLAETRSGSLDDDDLRALRDGAGERICEIQFGSLLQAIGLLHPIRYREVARHLEMILVHDVAPVRNLSDALRWVHFVDSLYDGAVALAVTGRHVPLTGLFDPEMLAGPFGKKLARCLSRMEEMLEQSRRTLAGP